MDCDELKTVYLTGSRSAWNALLKNGTEHGNDVLKSAKIYWPMDCAKVFVADQKYTAAALTPKIAVVLGEMQLTEGVNYNIQGFANNVCAGTATVTISGKGDYIGTKTGMFNISPKSIAECTVGVSAERMASGEIVSITATVLDGRQVLARETDYDEALQEDNSKIAITGKGNYTGTVLKSVPWVRIAAKGAVGSALTWTLYDSGLLAIEGNGSMGSGAVPWNDVRGSIASVLIGAGVTELYDGAFDGCENLKSISVAYGNPSYRASGGALLNSSGTELLRCPPGLAGVYTVPTGVVRFKRGAFNGCGRLESIVLPASVASLDAGALDGCTSLKSVSVAYDNTAFRAIDGVLFLRDGSTLLRCPKGKSGVYAIPSFTTVVAPGAFKGCTGLTGIFMSADMKAIGHSAFEGCANLANVCFAGTKREWRSLLDSANAGDDVLERAETHYDISAFSITFGLSAYPYTGEAITPEDIAVLRGDTTLIRGVDYVISGCFNNVNPGRATLTLSGINEYTGSMRASFQITHPYVLSVQLPLNEAAIGVGQTVEAIAQQARALPESAVNRALHWASNNPAVAAVDATTGAITGVKAGVCTITATSADVGSTASASLKLTVTAKGKGVSGIRLNTDSLTTYPGRGKKLTATLTPSTPYNPTVLWVSSDESVATVSGGLVTGAGFGTATITALASSGLTASCQVSVVPRYGTLTLDEAELVLGAGEARRMGYSLTLPDEPGTGAPQDVVSFASDNPKVVFVDAATGDLKGVRAGTATITARTASGLSEVCRVTVKNAPSKVFITAGRTTIGAGERLPLEAAYPSGMGGAVSWSLPDSQKALACIDPFTGILTAGSHTGTITPTATSYNGKTAEASIVIAPAPSYIALGEAEITLCAGDRHPLTYLLSAVSAGQVGYTARDEAVATVSAEGVVTAGQTLGSTVVRVETYNGKYDLCAVSVVEAPISLALSMDSTVLGVGETRKIACASEPADVPITLGYASGNSKVATVSSAGMVRGVKAGTAKITVTAYNGVSRTIIVTVKSAPSSVTLSSPSKLGLGETVNIQTATNGGSYGSITLTSSDPSVVRINADGTAIGIALGSAVITATTYNNKKALKTLTVMPAPTESTFAVVIDDGFDGLTIDKDSLGDTLSAAKGDRSSVTPSLRDGAGSVSFSSSNADIVSIDSAGKVGFVGVGKADITCATYNGIARKIPIEVLAAPSKISLDAGNMAIFNESSYSIALGESGETLEDRFDILHYSIASSNASVVRANHSEEMLKAVRLGSSNITVNLFNGAKATKKVSVHRNRMDRIEKQPSVFDAEYLVPEIWFKSVEVLSPNKIVVEFYLANNFKYRLKYLTEVELAFEADGFQVFDQVFKSITINVPPYSVRTIKATILGSENIDPVGISLADLSKCSPDDIQYWGDYDDAYWTR